MRNFLTTLNLKTMHFCFYLDKLINDIFSKKDEEIRKLRLELLQTKLKLKEYGLDYRSNEGKNLLEKTG